MIGTALGKSLSGTGAVDNAVLRADGTAGDALQNSGILIDDATTTTQNNIAIRNDHSGQTNSALVLTPKGTGAFILGPKPDGTATGGQARGTGSVDLQTSRSAATQTARGSRGFIGGGTGNEINTGNNSAIPGGNGNLVTGAESIAAGYQCQATNTSTVSFGRESRATALYAGNLSGFRGLADRESMQAHAAGYFATHGDAQRARFVLRNKTTTNSAVELFINTFGSTRLTIPSGKVLGLTINITGIKSDGSAVAHYLRQYCLKNVSGTCTEVYAPVTIGTDNAAGTSIALSANDTNDALKVEVTGIASETWRWVASVDAVEIAYGT